MLAWKRGDLLGVVQRLTVALAVGAVVAIAGAAWLYGQSILAAIVAGIAVFVIVGSLTEVLMRTWRPGLGLGMALRRAAGLPLSFWGAALAHIGVGVTLLGLAGVGFGAEAITTLREGVPQTVGPYQITLDSVSPRVGPNYTEVVATMTVRSGGQVVATIEPARRQFAARQMTRTEAGMATLLFGQVYVSIADPSPDGAVPARLYWKPLVTLIWLGGAVMALGGALSLADRRIRFGVAVRGRAGAVATAAK
jgi:cytochrome c-type biogenesis protein CcmF